MRVIPPVTITPAKLVSSTATEPHAPSAYDAGTTYGFGVIVSVAADFAIYESLESANVGNTPGTSPLWWRIIGSTETAYDAGTTYGLGATVSSLATKRCYESLQAANVGKPLPVLPLTETDWWLDIGPTNRWAAFDLDRNTQTVAASPLTFVFAPGVRGNSIYLGGLEADSVTISATSVYGGGAVYSYTLDLRTRIVTGSYEFCFAPFTTRPNAYVFDLPPVSDIIVTVSLSKNSGNVKCGSCVFGTYIAIGAVVEKPHDDATNFSRVDRDDFGTATINRRKSIPLMDLKVKVEPSDVNKVRRLRDSLNAIVCAWVGIEDASHDLSDALARIGFYEEFSLDHEPNSSTLNLRVQEI